MRSGLGLRLGMLLALGGAACQPTALESGDAAGDAAVQDLALCATDLPFSWYFKVCGANGMTYQYWEHAACAGVSYTSGSCDPVGCSVGEKGPPVCGVDGKTYPGDQTAGCYGVLRAHMGACEGDGGT